MRSRRTEHEFRNPPTVSDTYLMKGEWRGITALNGAAFPQTRSSWAALRQPSPLPSSNRTERNWIVFYSEAYELYSGRTQTFYAELLPELCLLAGRTNRKSSSSCILLKVVE